MEKKQITLKNGEVYHYLEQGQGEQVLLMVHGNFSSSLHYLPLVKKMPKDMRVLVPDLRGFGDSSYYNRISSLKDLADDLSLFLEALKVIKADVIGWSLGGGVALEFAANYPKKTNKLVLINSASHKGYPVFKKDEKGQMKIGEVYATKEEMATDPVQVIPLLVAMKNKDFNTMTTIWNYTIYTVNKPDSTDNELWINESLKQRNLVDADWALANFNMSDQHNFYHQGTQTISRIKAPVLHIWGRKDIVVPEYMVTDNIEALKDQSTYIIYEACGHSPLVDVPEQLAKDILDFIQA
ncbi:MAG: alpha/beta fold hydrolase [Acholeplasmataceae bacterium]